MLTQNEFYQIFKKDILPITKKLNENKEACLKILNSFKYKILTKLMLSVFLVGFFITFILCMFGYFVAILIYIFVLFGALYLYLKSTKNESAAHINLENIKKELKHHVIYKMFNIGGQFDHRENNQESIPLEYLKSFGLFKSATNKKTDDIITGIYNGIDIKIEEFRISKIVNKHNKSKEYYTRGFILELNNPKNFNGIVVTSGKNSIAKIANLEKVEFEDISFMKNMETYTNDQIEARYIMTTSFIERLKNISDIFYGDELSLKTLLIDTENISEHTTYVHFPVSAIFVSEKIYIISSTSHNLFDISVDCDWTNPEYFYIIYMQIQTILQLIDYFKFNQNLGL